MPRVRRRGVAARELTGAEEMALLIGGDWPALFGTEQAARESWIRHREELLAVVSPATRPAAWWRFEAAGQRQPGEREHQALERMGALTGQEQSQLARWKQQYPEMWAR